MNKKLGLVIGAMFAMGASQAAMATCKDIGTFAVVQAAANTAATKATGGYGLPMWVTVVDESGMVCEVTTSNSETVGNAANDWNVDTPVSGSKVGNKQWLGSRVISAQKANTANAFSVDGYAISTANLNAPTNPGGSLYGLQHSNPIDASRAYGGGTSSYGTKSDYLRNKRIGGVNVFGGGLALYKNNVKIGAVGVSGDTSCRDHAFAWEVRKALQADDVPTGITAFNAGPDAVGDAALVVALTNAAGGAVIGDELIIDVTKSSPGIQENAGHIVAGGSPYWSNWSQPQCPVTALTHESYVFVGPALQ